MRPDESIATRQSLLERLQNWGDRESWQEFFDRYWRLIYNMAVKAGLSDAAAQDVVQDTVISVARKIEGYTYDPAACTFKSWMLRFTRWRILNEFRSQRRESQVLHQPDMIEGIPDTSGFDWETIWEVEWKRNAYQAALDQVKRKVSAEQFQIFDLHVLEQRPVKKVANLLGIPVSRVYLAKHRIGRLLQKEIRRMEVGE